MVIGRERVLLSDNACARLAAHMAALPGALYEHAGREHEGMDRERVSYLSFVIICHMVPAFLRLRIRVPPIRKKRPDGEHVLVEVTDVSLLCESALMGKLRLPHD